MIFSQDELETVKLIYNFVRYRADLATLFCHFFIYLAKNIKNWHLDIERVYVFLMPHDKKYIKTNFQNLINISTFQQFHYC